MVAISGEIDYVVAGDEVIGVAGGDPLLTKVTGSGCALGALMAAFLGVADSPVDAAVTASAVFGAAGQRAAAEVRGPGSLAVALLDQLYLARPGRVGGVTTAGKASAVSPQLPSFRVSWIKPHGGCV